MHGHVEPDVLAWTVNHIAAAAVVQWATGFQTLYPHLVRGARTVLAATPCST